MSQDNESVSDILQTLDGLIVMVKKFLETAITMRVEAAMLEHELVSMYRPELLNETDRVRDAEILENSKNPEPPE